MSTPISAQSILNLLGHALGLSDLRFNEDQVCRLVIDGATVIDLEQLVEEHALYLISVVAANLPMSLETAELLLKANLFGRGTGGAVLSYDEAQDEVVLFQRVALQGDVETSFVATFESFLSMTELWSKTLLEHSDEADIEPAATPANSDFPQGFIRV